VTNIEIGYYACAIDTEGSIIVSAHTTGPSGHVGVGNSNREWVETFQRVFGGGIYTNDPNPKAKPVHMWRIVGRSAESFLRMIRPHLRMKQKQADLVLLFIGTLGSKRVSDETLALRYIIQDEMRILNKRGRVQ
jgi:hypothetical protein